MSSGNKTGVYLIGALGSIASMAVAGALALKKKLAPTTGMVTCSEIFDGVDLVEPGSLVFGGCDIRSAVNSRDIFEKMIPVAPGILLEIKAELEEFQHNVDSGCAKNCGEAIEKLAGPENAKGKSLEEEIEDMRGRLQAFRRKYSLDEVIVVNLASTEPPLELEACHFELESFQKVIAGE